MKKKIGIVTFHRAYNYGALLQAYALQKKINEENDAYIIDYRNKNVEKSYKLLSLDFSNIKMFIKSLIASVRNFNKKYNRFKKFKKFIVDEFKLSEEYKNENILKEKFPKYDIYITGSDQVWNPQITGTLSDIYTLNFGDNAPKRISYAASCGSESYIVENKSLYKEKLSKLDNISVREESTQKELTKIFDKDVTTVLDPTLLLKKEEWESVIENVNCEISEKYILAYVVAKDDEYFKIVNELSKKTGLKVVHFYHKNNDLINVIKNAYSVGPLEFVKLIKESEYVVATSFHATVFSIIFNKNFFVIPHKKTGSRVIDLLDKLGLSNRACHTLEEFKQIDYSLKSDWKRVNKKIIEEREKSLNWLKEAIDE